MLLVGHIPQLDMFVSGSNCQSFSVMCECQGIDTSYHGDRSRTNKLFIQFPGVLSVTIRLPVCVFHRSVASGESLPLANILPSGVNAIGPPVRYKLHKVARRFISRYIPDINGCIKGLNPTLFHIFNSQFLAIRCKYDTL